MHLTASEQATINFYQWEFQHRGYYHFETPVDIEVPYIPFHHHNSIQTTIKDDGQVPSLFKQVSKLFLPSHKKEETEKPLEVQPRFLAVDETPNLVGISLAFPKGTEIVPHRNIELLNMLAFSEHNISFEIVATFENITIQIVCSEQDKDRITSHLKAFFPNLIQQYIEIDDFGFSLNHDVAIADFGINDEFMRPLAVADSFTIDPLTSVIATMDTLHEDDIVVFQVLFKGISSPLAKDISYSVSDGSGGSFFTDAPEMPKCAQDKITNSLFSVVMRIASQGKTDVRSQYLAQELARSISAVSSSQYNKLIPLSNVGYQYDFHFYNLHHRTSNRLGFIINSKELNTFVHYPNKTVISENLGIQGGKTKQVPQEAINHQCTLGINEHNGIETKVSLSVKARLKHTYIVGATGTGKSTLIAHMMLQDINNNKGCILFDPHGDITDDILLRIPEKRKNDVILIDPSDVEFPIGFNLFQTYSEAEKIVLSSDLVSSFKRYATAWGDNMTAVLSHAINTFLESNKGGTLIELKRFLLEDSFRDDYLKSVDDPSLHYYWEHEYAMVKKGIAPLLTRIDTFLRPKIVRYMLAQKQGIDLRDCIEENKIVLVKLSIGLIGRDNAYLLGSLFLSKLNQVALGRQHLPKEQRSPYFVYIDEFHNFITPSMSEMLAGVRKYGLGLTLSHQELGQIDDAKILNAIIANPYTRICFRLGDIDARKLEGGFSYFERDDLMNLTTGQAIVRIGGVKNDCNLKTLLLPNIDRQNAKTIKEHIIRNTRTNYAQPRATIETLLVSLLPKTHKKKESKKIIPQVAPVPEKNIERDEVTTVQPELPAKVKDTNMDSGLEARKTKYLQQAEEQETIRKHRSLQYYVRSMAQQRGFKATLETSTENGGQVDVALLKDDIRIAIEISVTNRVDYEVQNIQKCIDDTYSLVYMISDDAKHLQNIKEQALKTIPKKQHPKIHFFASKELSLYLDALQIPESKVKRVRGYRVKVDYKTDNDSSKQSSITNIIMKALRGKK